LDAEASAVSTDRPQAAAIDQVLTHGDAAGDDEVTQLRRNSVGLSGVTGQSLSAMGLSGVIGTSVPVVAILAGAGGWLTWAIAAVIIMFVALSISVLARRFATTGGLYGLAAKALRAARGPGDRMADGGPDRRGRVGLGPEHPLRPGAPMG
jgi:hypothetical protein